MHALRIALLTILESVEAGSPMPRALLRVGGRSLAWHQLALARALECQRIVCLAAAGSPELLALQHEAESAGIQFHRIADAWGLLVLVTASDELVVLADGLLADRDAAVRLLGSAPAILTLPSDPAVGEGFERIDANHAAAGAMRLPGRLVERLADLPRDSDAVSSLTRLALQQGTALRDIPAEVRAGGRWCLIRSEADADDAERQWIRGRADLGEDVGLSGLLARYGVLGFGQSLLQGGNAGRIVWGAMLVLLGFALVAAWFEATAAAIAFCGVAAVAQHTAILLGKVEAGSDTKRARAAPTLAGLGGFLLDLALACAVVWSGSLQPWYTTFDSAFAIIMLLLMMRLVPRLFAHRLSGWLEDRAVLALLLIAALGAGLLPAAIRAMAVGLAIAGILQAGRSSGQSTRITRV